MAPVIRRGGPLAIDAGGERRVGQTGENHLVAGSVTVRKTGMPVDVHGVLLATLNLIGIMTRVGPHVKAGLSWVVPGEEAGASTKAAAPPMRAGSRTVRRSQGKRVES